MVADCRAVGESTSFLKLGETLRSFVGLTYTMCFHTIYSDEYMQELCYGLLVHVLVRTLYMYFMWANEKHRLFYICHKAQLVVQYHDHVTST